MADTKTSGLDPLTGANTSPSDLVFLVDVSDLTQGAGGTSKSQTRQEFQTYNAGTLTTDVNVLNLSATWNNAAVTFTGIEANFTDTASNAASRLMDLQVGGTTKFKVDKTGTPYIASDTIRGINGYMEIIAATYDIFLSPSGGTRTVNIRATSTYGLAVCGDYPLGFSPGPMQATDVALRRDAANTLALRNSTSAQTFNIYNTYTDASNYERLSVGWASNILWVQPETLGTGNDYPEIRFGGQNATSGYFSYSGSAGLTLLWSSSTNLSKAQFLNGNIQFSLGTTTNFIGFNTSGSNRVTLADGVNLEFNTTTGTKIGTATTQKLAFYNSTPVAQQSGTGETVGFTAGAGTNVTDQSTFTGNVGSTAYRISDVVKALKNYGMLAA